MAKKQTRRSISVSRTTYERLKSFCEANNISMSQLVENRVNDFLGGESAPSPSPARPTTSTPTAPSRPTMPAPTPAKPPQSETRPAAVVPAAPVPMTAASARFAVEPPPPIIKQKQQENAPKPTEKSPDQIFTF
jgi:hypothetical protein